jgi:hypothetical protein
MSRKDFEAIAAVLAGDMACSTPAERWRVQCITLSLADVCAKSNPRFDRERFYVAAGLDKHGALV